MNRRIPAIAFPSIIANITTPLLGLVDTAIVGHMGAAVYIGAIAVGGMMFNMLYWLFSFLRAGTSGIAAQAVGAGDKKEQSILLWRSLGVGFGIGVAMLVLQVPICRLLVWFVEPDAPTAMLAGEYFRILIWGAPAVLASFGLSGWFLGMQNSKMLMVTSLVINLSNIAASLILVYLLKWQIAGVATGTLIAQWLGLATGLLMTRRFHPRWYGFKAVFEPARLMRFFKVNIDVMLRTICLICVTVWFTKMGARQGQVILAVNALLMQLFMLFSYMMDGFAYAAEALVGKYVGAGRKDDLKRCVREVFIWSVCLASLFTVGYFLGGEGFLRLLSSDSDVIAASAGYYFWAALIPFAGFAAFAWDGVFIGATLTRQLLLSMLAATLVFFGVEAVLWQRLGNHALWLAFICYLAVRGGSQWGLYRHWITRTSLQASDSSGNHK